jgi:ATP-dependent DNA ligase
MRTLPWFPPAPAPGPASILSLPPDDWVMQPKIDGIRVIIYRGEPFTRLGQPLSGTKGAAGLRSTFAGLKQTLDGEWLAKEGKYYAFDVPDEPGDYDHRCKVLCELASLKIPGLIIMDRYEASFPEVYEAFPRDKVEGVVFKRRSSHYAKQRRPSAETRDWLKRRFAWDPQSTQI